MKTRSIKKKKTDITQAHFENAMKQYAEAEQKEAGINKIIETECEEVLQKYEDQRSQLSKIKSNAFETAYIYCVDNKETLFNKRRSIGTLYGIAGFRLGTPRLKTAKGKSWEKILLQLKEKLPDYIRTIEEPAKDRILADRNTELVAPLLIQIGLEVVQEELFYIDTKTAA